MPRNTLSDLNNHLFAQLERLGDEDLSETELKLEVERAKAISGVAKNIISNAKVTLSAMRFVDENLDQNKKMPDQFKDAQLMANNSKPLEKY